MLRITIEADTRQDMLNHLVEWVAVLSGQQGVEAPGTQPEPDAPTAEPLQFASATGVDTTAEPKKRGRPRKDEAKLEPKPEPAAPVDPMAAVMSQLPASPVQTEVPVEIPSHEQAIAALMKVAAVRSGDIGPTTGYERVAKILQAHGLTNVKGIKEAHRASIIAACVAA